ncbi:MAG: hypothetical protein HQL26_06100 [Candidatus Omnitrophica bacterium]|nr:hypothetical protein [Candidatus Omnitrophota bacterium]
MSQLIRTYKKYDVNEVKAHLMIYGDLAAQCANCSELNVKLDMHQCPHCKTEYKYIAFRNVLTNMPKLHKIVEQRPSLQIIDHDDYKRHIGASKAQELFGDK